MVDKIINNIKLPNGEVYAIGGGSRYGLKGDYSTHYGIEYCQHGLIDNPVGTTNIIVKGGMMLCLPGADTKTTIGSDITYSIESMSDVTIFYADGNILEAGEVHYSLTEPADNGIENYIAWWNPDFGKWQFKSNDTGNVWREAIATPIADIRIEEGSIVRIDYIGYRVLNDDIYGLKSETANVDLSNLTEEGINFIIKNSAGASLFDTKLVDHILTYEQTKGWALQGTYVYKEAVAGSRYGYPDFYAKCLEEYQDVTNTESVISTNVDIVGSLANNEGILSGFSASNYATLPNTFNPTSNTWEQVWCFTTGSSSTTFQSIIGGVSGFANPLYRITSDGYIQMLCSTNNSSWDIGITGSSVLTANTKYYIKGSFNGTEYKLELSTNRESFTTVGVVSNTSSIYIVDKQKLGNNNAGNETFLGSIDLKESYININGQRWWTGADTVIANINGHRFYDISEKSKIDELYNTNGIAWYYGVDTENERIFLPRTKWFIQPSGEITEVNTVNEAGLPNITGYINNGNEMLTTDYELTNIGGAFGQTLSSATNIQTSSSKTKSQTGFDFNASRSNPIYGNSDTVQPPSISQLLYICVGNTNVESAVTDVVDVTTTENDTVPLGYSTYQNGTQPNVSWLKSQGQWNDGNVYTTFYNEFVQKIGQTFASGYVREITEEYDDYDLVINQTDITFRLPLLDGSESVIDYTTNVSIPTDVGSTFIAPKRGYVYAMYADNSSTMNRTLVITINGVKVVQTSGYNTSSSQRSSGQLIEINKGDTLLVVEHNTSESKITFFPCKSNGSLYFKVANAVQNLELLDAGEVLEVLSTKTDKLQACEASFPSSKYINLTLGASGTTYTAPANGWAVLSAKLTIGKHITIFNVNTQVGTTASFYSNSGNILGVINTPCKKGDTFQVVHNTPTENIVFRFVYAEGEV